MALFSAHIRLERQTAMCDNDSRTFQYTYTHSQTMHVPAETYTHKVLTHMYTLLRDNDFNATRSFTVQSSEECNLCDY